jgi:branched-chain amino acid transport system substrate-binding protein
MMMKRTEAQKGKWLMVLVLLFALSVMGWSQRGWAQQKPFKIGYLAGLTGPFAAYNLPAQAGIKIAVEEINAAGGFMGRKIEIYSRDCKERPDVSISEARDLIQSEGVDVLIGTASGSAALAVCSVAKRYKVPFLACPSQTFITGEGGGRYVFQIGPSTDLDGFSIGAYLADKPWKRYYLLGTDYVFAHEVIENAWKRLTAKRSDVKRIGAMWPKVGERDYTPYITATMSANPDAVIAVLPAAMGVDFRRQAKGYGFYNKIQLIAAPLSSADRVPLGKETPEGIIGETLYAFPYCGEHYPLAAKVEKIYHKISHGYDYDSAMAGYNQLLFLQAAIKKARSTDKEKIIDAGEGLEFDSTVGRIKVLKYSHRGAVPMFLGVTTYSPKYSFAIFKDVKEYKGEKYMFSEDEVRKMRGE